MQYEYATYSVEIDLTSHERMRDPLPPPETLEQMFMRLLRDATFAEYREIVGAKL